MSAGDERALVDACLQVLADLPDLRPQLVTEPGGERLRLRGRWGGADYRPRPVPRLSPESLELIRQQQRRERLPLLLLCPHVGPRQAVALREQGLQFVDTVGNAFLQAPPLYLEISGRRRVAPPPRPARAFTTAGLKLVAVLLQQPQRAAADYRTLAAEAGIALGAVGAILRELAQQHYLTLEGRQRRLTRPDALLLRWQLGYLEQLRPRLLLQTCRLAAGQPVAELPQAIHSLGLEPRLLLGGELGAARLCGRGQAQRAALHLAEGDALRVMLQLRLTPAPDGPVTLLRRFGRGNAWDGWQPDTVPLADPLLLHGELAAAGLAASPLADQLQEEFLRPRLVPATN